jgi:Ca2+-binding EF-hand superfamily protein
MACCTACCGKSSESGHSWRNTPVDLKKSSIRRNPYPCQRLNPVADDFECRFSAEGRNVAMRRISILGCSLGLVLALPAYLAAQEDSQRPRRESAALFGQLDSNNDGVLTKDEVPQRRQRLFSRLLNGSDKDKDGKLSRGEFAAGLNDDENRAGEPDARPAGDRQAARDGAGRGPAGQRGAMMAGTAVLRALDADGDGSISTSEIEGAVAALKKLDKNSDGQLTRQELESTLTDRAGGAPAPGGRGRGGAPGRGAMLERLRQFDQNGDGKFSKDELPPRLQERFDTLDANKDGFINPRELPAGQRSGADRPRRGEGANRPGPRGNPPNRNGAGSDGAGSDAAGSDSK